MKDNRKALPLIKTLADELRTLNNIQDDNDENITLFELKSDRLYPFGEWAIDEMHYAIVTWLSEIESTTNNSLTKSGRVKNRTSVLETINEIITLLCELSEVWDDNAEHIDLNDFNEFYPFGESLDEVCITVINWRDGIEDELQQS